MPRTIKLSPGGREYSKKLLFLPLLALSLLLLTAPTSQAQTPTEYQVKAAFLYNFAKFIDWPAKTFQASLSPFTFCVVGEDSLGSDLETLVSGKQVKERKIIVRRLRSVQGLEGCQVVFIGAEETARSATLLRTSRNMAVLTVGETQEFAQQGGIVNFFLEDNKVRIEINVDGADRSGLKISSRLLKLAKVIRDDGKS